MRREREKGVKEVSEKRGTRRAGINGEEQREQDREKVREISVKTKGRWPKAAGEKINQTAEAPQNENVVRRNKKNRRKGSKRG